MSRVSLSYCCVDFKLIDCLTLEILVTWSAFPSRLSLVTRPEFHTLAQFVRPCSATLPILTILMQIEADCRLQVAARTHCESVQEWLLPPISVYLLCFHVTSPPTPPPR